MKNKVVVVGSYNTDLVIKTARIPKLGETVIGGTFSESGGGKGANQAVAAIRAGAEVSLIAKVGNDLLGKEAIDRLTKEGINTDYIFRDNSTSTGVAFIIVDEKGENSIVVSSGANSMLNYSDIEKAREEILSADVLLVQLESPIAAVQTAIKIFKEKGKTVILNPAPAQPLTKEFLRDVDIITPNIVEAEMITGLKITNEHDFTDVTDKFSELGIKNVIITQGAAGVFTNLSNKIELFPSYKVQTVDSTGAGDIFSGSLAAFLAEGMQIDEAIKMSNASAAISVTRMGAQTSAPYRKEIEEFIIKHNSSFIEQLN